MPNRNPTARSLPAGTRPNHSSPTSPLDVLLQQVATSAATERTRSWARRLIDQGETGSSDQAPTAQKQARYRPKKPR